MAPHVLILRAPGTNCDLETAYAFEKAGATTERIHINRLLENPALFKKFQILCFPGGFSYGDDIASGRILANQLLHHLSDELMAFREEKKLILGICNGFQILIKTGLLFFTAENETPQATLAWNNCGRFQDYWVKLVTDLRQQCVFLRDTESLYIPMAHAEGRFVAKDISTLEMLDTAGQLALRYAPQDATAWHAQLQQNNRNSILPYPVNPNGAQFNVAGMCDKTGLVLGLMPHPERFIDATQHPQWTRRKGKDFEKEGDGMKIFRNAVNFFL